MNTKLYKQVYALAGALMEAHEDDDEAQFGRLYGQLSDLCYANEADTHKNHPVQWETLADFTDDTDKALSLYKKALACAEIINAKDYMASIYYAMAKLLLEEDRLDASVAMAMVEKASENAAEIEDRELQNEIAGLLRQLETDTHIG